MISLSLQRTMYQKAQGMSLSWELSAEIRTSVIFYFPTLIFLDAIVSLQCILLVHLLFMHLCSLVGCSLVSQWLCCALARLGVRRSFVESMHLLLDRAS